MPRIPHILLAAALAVAVLAPGMATAAEGPWKEDIRHVANVPGSTGGHSVAEGDRLYVGAYGFGMRIFDIANRTNPVEIGRWMPGFQSTSDPGVRADAVPDAAVWEGRHIASLGGTSRASSTQQTEFLDVTDPANPELLWRFTGSADGESHNGDIVDDRRLWLPSGGGVGLRIYDMNPLLADPPAAPQKLFAANPVKMWEQSPHRGDRPVGSPFSHIHDIEVYTDREIELPREEWVDADGDGTPDPTTGLRDIALLAEGGSYLANGNTGSIFVIDITDPANPVALYRFQNSTGHPWRYFHEIQFLESDPDVVIVTDEDLHNGCEAGGIMAIELTPNLQDGTKLSEWFNGSGTPAPVCSAHVISTSGPYVFMGSYNAGLQVIDYSDPANPVRAGQYIAEGANAWGALHYDGYVYVGDFGGRGLDVFEFMGDPAAQGWVQPNPAGTVAPGANEALCENGQAGTPTVDALQVDIPEELRDGNATIRVTGSGVQPYALNVYFHDASCGYMDGTALTAAGRDTRGQVPKGAAYAFVYNVQGATTYLYAQLTAG